MTPSPSRRVPIEAKSVAAPLSGSAVFLVLSCRDHPAALDTVRNVLSSLSEIVKGVAFRDLDAALSCVAGFGARVWTSLTNRPLPASAVRQRASGSRAGHVG